MSEIDKWVNETFLNESESNIKRVIAIYPGRFQPMGLHHSKTYNWLSEQFGIDNTFIGTSNKTEIPSSPFNFKEKQKIIESYGIKNVTQVTNPYIASEILENFDSKTTSVVFLIGEKDEKRLSGKFFHTWNENATIPYTDGAYVLVAPHISINENNNELSGTSIRKSLGGDSPNKEKIFESIFGHTKKPIYNLVVNKLEGIDSNISEFVVNYNIPNLIKEISITAATTGLNSRGGNDVDDGPGFMYPKMKNYRQSTSKKAQKLGWEIVNYLVPNIEIEEFPRYPNAAVDAVSYFPSGVAGKQTPMNQKDFKGTKAYNMWKKHITNIIGNIGYSFVNWKDDAKIIKQSSKKEPNKPSKETNIVDEGIDLPVEIGQTVLMGKWKNKPVKVKTIDWNEKGDLLINGKSALRMRIPITGNIFGEDPRKKPQAESDVNEVEEDTIYNNTINYEYETPSGKKQSREITYASVIAQGEDHPLYKQIRKEIDDDIESKKLDEIVLKYFL